METPTTASTTPEDFYPKTDKSRWTVSEESTLIDLVLGNEELLFGALVGPNKESIRRSRQRCWEEICQQLNSQFSNSKKDVLGIKKKFSNIKQRTKEKIDEAKKSRQKTGGGPQAPQCTPAENALLRMTGDRPGMAGIPSGIDSDASTKKTDTVPETETDTVIPPSATTNSTKQQKNVGKRKKTMKELIDEETLKNLRLDNERLETAIQVQKEELSKIKNENSLILNKSYYYSLKLQSEFNIVLQNDE